MWLDAAGIVANAAGLEWLQATRLMPGPARDASMAAWERVRRLAEALEFMAVRDRRVIDIDVTPTVAVDPGELAFRDDTVPD